MALELGPIFWCAILIFSLASFTIISAIVCVKGVSDLKQLLRDLSREKEERAE